MMDRCFSDEKLLVNWDFIDINLLELVAKELDVIDYIRFRAVCKTWRSISIIPAGPLLPWLITRCDRVDGRLFYISFTDDKLHSIVVPALKENKSVEIGIVSCEGWLVLEGQHNSYTISLLNPLTGALVHLPQVPKQLFTRRIQYNMHFDPLHPEATMNYVEIQYLIHRMAISSHPLTTADCVIVVISAGNKALVSLRMGVHGFSSWRLMNDEGKYEDVAFFQERFVAVNCFGEVSTFSGINLDKLSTVPSPSMELNKTDWKFSCVFDRLLLLFQKVSDCEGYASFQDRKVPFYKTRRVNTYKLIRESGVGSPIPLKFVEAKFPHSVLFYGISSRPYVFLWLFSGMPNFIYIAGEHGEVADNERLVSFVIMPQAFDINNATLKPLFPQIETNSMISLWHMPRPFYNGK